MKSERKKPLNYLKNTTQWQSCCTDNLVKWKVKIQQRQHQQQQQQRQLRAKCFNHIWYHRRFWFSTLAKKVNGKVLMVSRRKRYSQTISIAMETRWQNNHSDILVPRRKQKHAPFGGRWWTISIRDVNRYHLKAGANEIGRPGRPWRQTGYGVWL